MTVITANRTIFQGFILSSFLSRELAHAREQKHVTIELEIHEQGIKRTA
jgi:hypothetical protein